MGLFDELEGAAGSLLGGQGQAGAAAQGGQGGAGQGGVVGAILQMVQQQPGGVNGVISSFEHAGLGGVVQSWISGGQNQAVSPGQVQQALGSGPMGAIASQLGVNNDQAANHLAQFLPQIMDHLSPGGQPPADGGMGALGGLLEKFASR